MDLTSWSGLTSGCLCDCFKNLDVAGAAAKISGQSFPYLIHGGISLLVQQMMGRENHSRRADAALCTSAIQESLLETIQPGACGQSFDGNDFRILDLKHWYEATVYQRAVQQHGAGATLAFATSFFGSGQSQLVPQYVQQSLHRINAQRLRLAVYGE
jgi:hypothetical protein